MGNLVDKTNKLYWVIFASVLVCGLMGISLVILTWLIQSLHNSLRPYYSHLPPSQINETESIWMILKITQGLDNVSTTTKHREGYSCAVNFGDLGYYGEPAVPCPEPGRFEEMLYADKRSFSVISHLCCLVSYKKRQCKGRIPCGALTTQRHCAAPNAHLFNNGTREMEVAETPDMCRFEDEQTCCIGAIYNFKAESTPDIVIVLRGVKSLWKKSLQFVVLVAIFVPPFCIAVDLVENF